MILAGLPHSRPMSEDDGGLRKMSQPSTPVGGGQDGNDDNEGRGIAVCGRAIFRVQMPEVVDSSTALAKLHVIFMYRKKTLKRHSALPSQMIEHHQFVDNARQLKQ